MTCIVYWLKMNAPRGVRSSYTWVGRNVMATVRKFWYGFIHRGTIFLYLKCSRSHHLSPFRQMFRRRRTPSARSSLLIFHIDPPIARISSSLCCTGSLVLLLSLWQRDRNRMDSYLVSTMDVSESPIFSGARGPWLQQRCDSLHCLEEWCGSVPPSAVVFSWALDEGGSTGTCSNTQRLPSTLEESVVQYYPSVSYATMNITFTAHSFDWRFKFGSYEQAQVSSIATIRPRNLSPSFW